MASGGDKTEKATPKKRDDARKKGQVAKSMDLNGAAVLFAALLALSAMGPFMWNKILVATQRALALVASPDVVEREGIGPILSSVFAAAGLAVIPVAAACLVAGVL